MDNKAKAAERSRLYRQRHREEINQRKRDIMQRKKNSHQIQTLSNVPKINEIEQITHPTSNNQESSNLHRQRQQRYYERHKEEIYKRKKDRRLKQNILKSIPATAAERIRNYRNKQKINEQKRVRVDTECNINNIDAIAQITDATPNHQQNLNSSNDTILPEVAQNFTNTLQQHNAQYFDEIYNIRVAATADERNRNYRERHKQKINERRRDSRRRQQNVQRVHAECNINNIDDIEQITDTTPNHQQNLNSSNDTITPETSQNSTSTLQHNAQDFEETYNDRVRTTTKQNFFKLNPTTAAERNRNYRERNKEKINERRRDSRRRQQNVQGIHTDNINNIDAIEQQITNKI